MASIWRINLFGGLQAQQGDRIETHFGNRKVAALLSYLVLFPAQAHPREMLAELLWPDEDSETTRDRFRQALSVLRRMLESEETQAGAVLIADRSGVRFVPGAVTTDVAEFEAGVRETGKLTALSDRATHLTQTLDLYRGELLPGYYEDWTLTERERLAELHRSALSLLAEVREQQGDLAGALDIARRVVAGDPLREDAQQRLMRIYAAAGRLSDAVRQYRELERVLSEQLNSIPSPATQTLFARLRSGIHMISESEAAPAPAVPHTRIALEPEGGAVPLDSQFYLIRDTDRDFEAAIARRDSIVLVKGARQVGKTSLLARGLQQARRSGTRVVLTDLQKLTAAQMESADALFFSLAEMLAEQLELEVNLEALWSVPRGWNVKFERFLRREVLGKITVPIVWGLDEIDRLFGHSFSTEVFGLFRSWHNERSLDPESYWSRLTLAIAYATEAHLFITDLNQSPFNVGTRLLLDEFTPTEAAEINRRYGAPLRDASELARYYALVGGNPYLVRRGLHAMTTQGVTLAALEAESAPENGVFGDALRRMMEALAHNADLIAVVRDLIQGRPIPDPDSFYRLRSAGVVIGASEQDAQIRPRLYRDYLRRHLR
jgi:DNA-binding SARP family transcriptional activator